MTTKNVRPKFLNLLRIHLPITGVVSIAHRITGALLILFLPFAIYLFSRSLQNEQGFEFVARTLNTGWVKLLGSVFALSLLYHLIAGVRFLLLDMDIGIKLHQARASAWLVAIIAVLLLLIMIVGWWL